MSSRLRIGATVLALTLFVLQGATAGAQDTAAPAGAYAAWNARIVARLKLDLHQQQALSDYEATLADTAPGAVTADQFRALTLPARLTLYADNMAQDAAKMRARADAAKRFYALLAVDQQKAFDEATQPAANTSTTAPAPVEADKLVAPNYHLPSRTNPDWLVRPTADEVSRVYPANAARDGVNGRAVLACDADEEGYLTDCVVESETPAGAGFGNAALEMTAYMRMKPATQYGVPTRAPVVIPVGFQVPQEAATPAASFDKIQHDACLATLPPKSTDWATGEAYCICVVSQLDQLTDAQKQTLAPTSDAITAAGAVCKARLSGGPGPH
ncbi:MAG TPA: TonB family protein [Caulobacteraceae bacterium]|jgi:TonB family protein|nr:TonB family protein [Caulobacteraceae bacterium]